MKFHECTPKTWERFTLAFCFSFLLLFAFPCIAQDNLPNFFEQPGASTEVQSSPKSVKVKKGWAIPFGAGISVGAKGLIAIDAAATPIPHFNLRLGFNSLGFSVEKYKLDLSTFGLSDQTIVMNGEIHQDNIELLAELAPWGGVVRLVGGVAFHIKDEISGDGILQDDFTFRDVTATPEEIGYVEGIFGFQNQVSPYLGLGFGRLIPRRRVGFNVDVGTYYRGSPTVDINATGLLRNNAGIADQLETNLSEVRWWPVVALRLAFRISTPAITKQKQVESIDTAPRLY